MRDDGRMQMRKQTRTKSIEKRQRILDATARLIAQKGTANITLHDVGGEVGIYAASIYYYFASREELIKEVHMAALGRLHATVADAITSAPSDSSPLDRLRRALAATIDVNGVADDYALAYSRVFDQAVASEDEEIRSSRNATRDLWHGLLKDAQDAGQIAPSVDITLLRFFMMGSIHWVSYWYRADGPRTTGEIADAFFRFLIDGAGTQKKDAAPDVGVPRPF